MGKYADGNSSRHGANHGQKGNKVNVTLVAARGATVDGGLGDAALTRQRAKSFGGFGAGRAICRETRAGRWAMGAAMGRRAGWQTPDRNCGKSFARCAC